MTETFVKPVNQRRRVAVMRIVLIAMVPLILFSSPALGKDSIALEILENLGVLLLIGGVIGRLWSILYSGGRKNKSVVQTGPYSIARHPLYMFSTIAVFGLGLMLGSIILTVALTVAVFVILSATARGEEAFLNAHFGAEYADYSARVPQIIPNFKRYASADEVTVDVLAYHRTMRDAASFLLLIPLGEAVEMLRVAEILPHFPIW